MHSAGRLRIVVFLLVGGAAHAGGWTQSQGHYYLRAGLHTLLPTRQYFDADGNRPRLTSGDYSEITQTLYGEYGLRDRLTASLAVNSYRVGVSDAPDDGRGDGSFLFLLGEFTPGVRARLTEGPFLAAIEAKLTIPRSFKQDPEPHRFGDGRLGAELDAWLSRGFSEFYTNLGAGLRLRDEAPVNQFLWTLQAGRPINRFVLELDFLGAHALADSSGNDNALIDTPTADSHVSIVPKAIAKLGPVQLDVYGQFTLFARAYPDGFRFGVGLAYLR